MEAGFNKASYANPHNARLYLLRPKQHFEAGLNEASNRCLLQKKDTETGLEAGFFNKASNANTQHWTVLMRLVRQQFKAGFKRLQLHVPYGPKLKSPIFDLWVHELEVGFNRLHICKSLDRI